MHDRVYLYPLIGLDYIELFGASPTGADSRSFVLRPGGAYDRWPCGTTAKLACLAAHGALAPGAAWVQKSVSAAQRHWSWRRDHGRESTWLALQARRLTVVISPRAP